jgi:hypothetical protein
MILSWIRILLFSQLLCGGCLTAELLQSFSKSLPSLTSLLSTTIRTSNSNNTIRHNNITRQYFDSLQQNGNGSFDEEAHRNSSVIQIKASNFDSSSIGKKLLNGLLADSTVEVWGSNDDASINSLRTLTLNNSQSVFLTISSLNPSAAHGSRLTHTAERADIVFLLLDQSNLLNEEHTIQLFLSAFRTLDPNLHERKRLQTTSANIRKPQLIIFFNGLSTSTDKLTALLTEAEILYNTFQHQDLPRRSPQMEEDLDESDESEDDLDEIPAKNAQSESSSQDTLKKKRKKANSSPQKSKPRFQITEDIRCEILMTPINSEIEKKYEAEKKINLNTEIFRKCLRYLLTGSGNKTIDFDNIQGSFPSLADMYLSEAFPAPTLPGPPKKEVDSTVTATVVHPELTTRHKGVKGLFSRLQNNLVSFRHKLTKRDEVKRLTDSFKRHQQTIDKKEKKSLQTVHSSSFNLTKMALAASNVGKLERILEAKSLTIEKAIELLSGQIKELNVLAYPPSPNPYEQQPTFGERIDQIFNATLRFFDNQVVSIVKTDGAEVSSLSSDFFSKLPFAMKDYLELQKAEIMSHIFQLSSGLYNRQSDLLLLEIQKEYEAFLRDDLMITVNVDKDIANKQQQLVSKYRNLQESLLFPRVIRSPLKYSRDKSLHENQTKIEKSSVLKSALAQNMYFPSFFSSFRQFQWHGINRNLEKLKSFFTLDFKERKAHYRVMNVLPQKRNSFEVSIHLFLCHPFGLRDYHQDVLLDPDIDRDQLLYDLEVGKHMAKGNLIPNAALARSLLQEEIKNQHVNRQTNGTFHKLSTMLSPTIKSIQRIFAAPGAYPGSFRSLNRKSEFAREMMMLPLSCKDPKVKLVGEQRVSLPYRPDVEDDPRR